MSLRAREYEMSFGAPLDVCANSSLNGWITVAGNLLKFVNCYQARTVGLIQIREYFIQRAGRIVDRAQSHTPHRHSIHIK